jgi:hypothetical protein
VKTLTQPRACMVTVRQGQMCECRSCDLGLSVDSTGGGGGGGGDKPALCAGCNHPVMLHSSCARSPGAASGEDYWYGI